MPLGKGIRYRMKDGVRLAFKGRRVVETKNMQTGATHMMKPISHLPKGASLSPKGDLGMLRQKEYSAAGKGFKSSSAAPAASRALPVRKGMQLPK